MDRQSKADTKRECCCVSEGEYAVKSNDSERQARGGRFNFAINGLAGSRNLIRPSLPVFSTHKRAIRVSFFFPCPNIIWRHHRFQTKCSFQSQAQAPQDHVKAARTSTQNQPFIQGTRILQPSVQTNTKMSTFNSTCSPSPPSWPSSA